MDAYIEHTVQLREAAHRRTEATRSHTFEITAVLCVALIVATSWAVLAAGWVNGGGGAVVVAVTSVIEAALLAQARAPRIAAAIAAPFLGLAAIVPTTLAAMPPVPGQTLGAIAGDYARALLTGLSSTTDWDFTVGLCAILFLCGYWLGWMVLREHRGVLAVVPIFSVLATNVVNAENTDPIAVPETIAVCLALAVVAAAYLGSLGDRWASSRITALEGLGWRFGSSAAGVAVVLTIAALVIPPISSTDISARLFPNGSRHRRGWGESGWPGRCIRRRDHRVQFSRRTGRTAGQPASHRVHVHRRRLGCRRLRCHQRHGVRQGQLVSIGSRSQHVRGRLERGHLRGRAAAARHEPG